MFLLCGLWHGASWPFVLWGIWHGLFLVGGTRRPRTVLARLGPLAHVYALRSSWAAGCCSAARRSTRRSIYLRGAARTRRDGDPCGVRVAEFLDPLVATTLVIAVVGATPIARSIWARGWNSSRRSIPAARRALVLTADTAWLVLVLIAATAHFSRPAPTTRSSISGSERVRDMTSATVDRRPSLALPPVPPPAPAAHPWRDRIVALLFVLALVIPLAGVVMKRNLEETAFEKRRTVAWPAAPSSLAAWRTFPSAFEAAFADRFGGRDRLIALHHFTKTAVFGVSPVDKMLIGRDGWLFFLGEDGKSLDRDYRGISPYAPDEGKQVAAELKRRHDFLASLGIPYIVMIVPDKHTIYPEYLPAWVKRVEGETRLDKLYAALRAYPEVKVLDIRPALLAAKSRERLYFKTDSHWNYLGATVGYDELMKAVKAVVPSVPHVPADARRTCPAWIS